MAYKDSGVEWLGEIPAHWNLKRLRNSVARLESGGTPESDNAAYWTDEEHGIPWVAISDMTRDFRLHVTAKRITDEGRLSKRLRVLPAGTLLYSMYASLGKVALLETDAVINQAILGVVPRESEALRDYLRWWFEFMRAHVQMLSSSNTQDNLSAERVRNMPVVLPPALAEQRAIANFLDRETARIDALVAGKERLIELLQEKRTALITRAVTRGLDPNVPMKDSGVEWLGEIPTHWQVRPLKSMCGLQTGLTLGKRYEGEAMTTRPYLRVANVQDGYLALDDIAEIEVPVRDVRRFELRTGDVLMTEGGDFDKLGRGHVWEEQLAQCLHQNHIFAVRPRRSALTSHFLALVMTSAYGRAYFTATSKQSTNLASTNSTKLRNLPIPLPGLDDQVEITRWTDRESTRIDALVIKVREAIDHLRDLRTALISSAVTGKIDVREVPT